MVKFKLNKSKNKDHSVTWNEIRQGQTIEDANSMPNVAHEEENNTVTEEVGRHTIRRYLVTNTIGQKMRRVMKKPWGIIRTLFLGRPPHLDRAVSLSNDGNSSRKLFEQTQKIENLEEANKPHSEALIPYSPGHPHRSTSLSKLGIHLHERFKQTGKMEYLEDAIAKHREALLLCPPGPDRYTYLNILGLFLTEHYQQKGNMEDLEDAIAQYHEALILFPPGHPDCFYSLNHLGLSLFERFMKTGNMEDCEESIALNREVLLLCPPGHSYHSMSLGNLCLSLRGRFNQTKKTEDLEELIERQRELLLLCHRGHPNRSKSLDGLGLSLHEHFRQTGKMEDLEEAISQHHEALLLRPPGHLDRSESLNNLGSSVYECYERTGKMEDLEEAIAHFRETLLLCPPGNPHHSPSLNNLGSSMCQRFMRTGNMEDLEEAIAHFREALLDPHSSSSYFTNLGQSLITRFEQTGKMEDLEEAIAQHREALRLCSPGQIDCCVPLNNLGLSLCERFRQTGNIADCAEAIAQYHKALLIRPPGHPARSGPLNNLSLSLQELFHETGNLYYLEEAISHCREALLLRSPGHPQRSTSLNNLGLSLATQFEQTGKMEDLEEAISQHREALLLRPPGHPHRSISLNNLGWTLRKRFKKTWKMEDIGEAILQHHEALLHCPSGHPSRSQTLYHIARAIISRDEPGAGHNLAFDLWQQAVTDHYASPLSRFKLAQEWAATAMVYHHESALQAYSHATILLTHCLVGTPTVDSQHYFLARYTESLPYDAASCAIQAGQLDTAVELLEQGRSLLWSRMNSFRHPVESLYAVDCKLAERFQQLTAQLEHLSTSFTFDSLDSSSGLDSKSYVSFDAKMQLHHRLSEELVKIIDQIRETDGFQDFLQPVPFKHLQAVASEGPIIIVNISGLSSYAIILYQEKGVVSIVSIPLTGATPSVLDRLASELEAARSQHPVNKSSIFQFLRELWHIVVGPITYKLLELGIQQKSRVWWCPTSMLCSLPLHAAGPYTLGKKNFPDIYVSSYTPTLSALIRARTPAKNPLPVPNLLTIGITAKDVLPDMQRFNEEVATILQFPNISVTQLHGENATPDRVILELQQHSWVHFACHGHSDTQPFLSSFELNDGQSLSLLQLIKAQLPNAEFAFLSACHSAAGGISTPDESIHLAAALQFCGFRSTVGTLWSMADEDGPMIVEEFYKHIFTEEKIADYRDSARALNEATRVMRQHKVPIDRWICFVHIGA